jgi:hypothetical protein
MTLILNGTNGVTFPDSTDQATGYANGVGFRNRIINGDMRIDQRNAGAAVTGLTVGAYFVDRWTAFQNYGTVTRQQSTTAPTGFQSSLYTTVTSTASVISTSVYAIVQSIEGTNVSDLAFGSASAKTITVSFQVRSNVTGTYGVFIRNSAANRWYASTFNISSADTWEAKTVTIAGDTSGTWLTNTGIGLTVGVVLGAGATRQGTANTWTTSNDGPYTTSSQVDWMSNNGATFYITGVQLEVGSVATPFERRPFGTELMLCQRYYYQRPRTQYLYARSWDSGIGTIFIQHPEIMRAAPTITVSADFGNMSSTSDIRNIGFSMVSSATGSERNVNCDFTYTSNAEL